MRGIALIIFLSLTLNNVCRAEVQQAQVSMPSLSKAIVKLYGEVHIDEAHGQAFSLEATENALSAALSDIVQSAQTGLGFTCDHLNKEIVLSVDQASDAWHILVRGDHILSIDGQNPYERAIKASSSHRPAGTVAEIRYEHDGVVKNLSCHSKPISLFCPRMQAAYRKPVPEPSTHLSQHRAATTTAVTYQFDPPALQSLAFFR